MATSHLAASRLVGPAFGGSISHLPSRRIPIEQDAIYLASRLVGPAPLAAPPYLPPLQAPPISCGPGERVFPHETSSELVPLLLSSLLLRLCRRN